MLQINGEISLIFYQGEEFSGTIRRVSGKIDAKKHQVKNKTKKQVEATKAQCVKKVATVK